MTGPVQERLTTVVYYVCVYGVCDHQVDPGVTDDHKMEPGKYGGL